MHQNDLLDESQNETVSRMGQSTDSCVADILCDDSTIEVIGAVLKKNNANDNRSRQFYLLLFILQFRTFDGSCNNIDHPSWGKSNIPYKRLAHRKFSLLKCGNSRNLPNPRLASRLLMQRSDDDIDENLSLLVMGFGQFLDHDMMLTPSRKPTRRDCCSRQHRNTEDCCPIEVSYV